MKDVINDIYRSMFAAVGMDVTKDGFVRLIDDRGEIHPATKNGHQAVIPIPEQLMSPHINDRLVMHLLSENILEPESEQLAFFRSMAMVRLNRVVSTLMLDLLQLNASTARHATLSMDQAQYLSLVAEADGTTVKKWESLIQNMPARQTQQAITHIYLKKAGVVKDKTTKQAKSFTRVAVVNFPLYGELVKWTKDESDRQHAKEAGHKSPKKEAGAKSGRVIYDVEIRQKDRVPLMNLLGYLIPQISEPEAYNYGSNSMMAPGLDALMHSFMVLASRLNDVIDLFTGAIDDVEKLRFSSDWAEVFKDDIDALWPLVRDIPRMGSPAAAAAAAQVQQQAQQAQQATQVAPAVAPVVQPPQQPQQPPQGLPWNTAPQVQQPPAQPNAGQWVNGVWVPAAAAWQPQQPQPVAQPASPPPSGGGVSAADILRSNPAIAGAAMMAPQLAGQPMMMPPGMYPPGMMMPGMVMPGQMMYPGQMMPGMVYPGMAVPGMYPQQGVPQPLNSPGVPQGNLPWQQRRGY